MANRWIRRIGGCLAALQVAISPSSARAASASRVEFNRDVRPILAEHCLNCHGFDDKTRKGGLRLDLREDALKGGKSGKASLVPGRPQDSELVHRLTHLGSR
jgi:hypothetical protein